MQNILKMILKTLCSDSFKFLTVAYKALCMLRWPMLTIYPGLRGFVGQKTFSAKTRTIMANWVIWLPMPWIASLNLGVITHPLA